MKSVERKHQVSRTAAFNTGDTISVSFTIKEGDKERTQIYQGVVIQTRGTGTGKSVTVRKSSGNVYVERVFPINSPLISDIKVVKRGRVRRAKLYYLRKRTGKSTRIAEQK